jgi:hypothetical protein
MQGFSRSQDFPGKQGAPIPQRVSGNRHEVDRNLPRPKGAMRLPKPARHLLRTIENQGQVHVALLIGLSRNLGSKYDHVPRLTRLGDTPGEFLD